MKKVPKEALAVLRQASDEMSNNTCNDFCLNDTPANRKFLEGLKKWSDDEEMEIEPYKGKLWTQDWMVLDYIADLIEESMN